MHSPPSISAVRREHPKSFCTCAIDFPFLSSLRTRDFSSKLKRRRDRFVVSPGTNEVILRRWNWAELLSRGRHKPKWEVLCGSLVQYGLYWGLLERHVCNVIHVADFVSSPKQCDISSEILRAKAVCRSPGFCTQKTERLLGGDQFPAVKNLLNY